MYFEFYDDNNELKLCYLPLWQSIVTLIFGRRVAKHVPRKNIRFGT